VCCFRVEPNGLANPRDLESEESAQFFESGGEFADTHRAMVCGSLFVPAFDESPGADRESVAAVGVADFEDRAGPGPWRTLISAESLRPTLP
jgi:hypothetical protein